MCIFDWKKETVKTNWHIMNDFLIPLLTKEPICLDESIHSVEDVRKAIHLGSCKIINIKIGRVGGLTESKKIHDLCEANGIPVWCGVCWRLELEGRII
jgi:L-alanine-DL-glutamate epimerase-like enolase superfamily enzyme